MVPTKASRKLLDYARVLIADLRRRNPRKLSLAHGDQVRSRAAREARIASDWKATASCCRVLDERTSNYAFSRPNGDRLLTTLVSGKRHSYVSGIVAVSARPAYFPTCHLFSKAIIRLARLEW